MQPSAFAPACLNLLRRRFYPRPGDARQFALDRRRLLTWVICYPAIWFHARGVTLRPETLCQILRRALPKTSTTTAESSYRPARLRQHLQKHLARHGAKYS
jgi:hypothetical protein